MLTDPQPTLQPEEKLLLALCRLDFSIQDKAEVADLLKEVSDWDRFLKLANEHGVIALEAYNLRELGLTEIVPGKIIEILDNARMKTLMRNTWQTQQWKEVNRILSAAGIKHVLLKGMALEHTVYRSLGLRQMTDTDILVKKSDALNAWQLLQQNGFVPEPLKSPLHSKIILDLGKHLPTLIRESYQVEIHHRLFGEDRMNDNLSDAIDNAVEFIIDGITAFVLNKNLHLLYLREHMDYHMITTGPMLKLYLDILLLDPGNPPSLPEGFVNRSVPHSTSATRKKIYRDFYQRLPSSVRFRYLAGDIFPSLSWMKQRYGCGTLKAFLRYLPRVGKVFRVM